MTTSYVIDKNKGYVSHQGSRESCEQYIRNATSLFGGSFVIADGAKNREEILRSLR